MKALLIVDGYNVIFAWEELAAIAETDLEDAVFVMAGHSYELEVLDHWGYMEQLLEFISGFGFENLTTMEFVNKYYPKT